MSKNFKIKRNVSILVFLLIIFMITFYAVCVGVNYDYAPHIKDVHDILEHGFGTFIREYPCPLWHVFTALFIRVFGISDVHSAAAVTALFNSICYIGTYCILSRENEKVDTIINSVFAFLLMIIGPSCPVCIMYWTPSKWHNPTHIAVRAIAVFAYLLIIDILQEYKKNKSVSSIRLVALSILLVLCNLAKPSFSQIIIPGLGLYLIIMIIVTRGRSADLFIRLLISFIPCAVLTLIQTASAFYSESSAYASGSGLDIAWMDVINNSFGGKGWMLPLLVIFPIYVFAVDHKCLKRTDVQLTLLVWLSSFLEAALLAEEGVHRYDGNFTWGFDLAEFFAFVISVKVMIEYCSSFDRKKISKWIFVIVGWAIFAVHLFIGTKYLIGFLLAK